MEGSIRELWIENTLGNITVMRNARIPNTAKIKMLRKVKKYLEVR